MVILAGGLATRLRPISEKIPKALVEVRGVPFIHYLLRWYSSQGVRHFVLSTGYKSEMIEESLGDGRNFGIKITYVRDGENLRGTGGAILNCLQQNSIPSSSFFLTYGDTFLPIQVDSLLKMSQEHPEKGILTIYQNSDQLDASNVEYDEKSQQLLVYSKKMKNSKMRYIDYGMMLLPKSLFDSMPAYPDLSDYMSLWVQEKRMLALPVFERFYEIGNLQSLDEVSQNFIEVPGSFPSE